MRPQARQFWGEDLIRAISAILSQVLHCPRFFLEENNITAPLQNGGGLVERYTVENIICSNYSNTLLKFESCTLST